MTIKTIHDLDLSGKRVILREDFNVPMNDAGEITSDVRLRAAIPTIRAILQTGAGIIILSHLGRPKEGQYDAKFSLEPIAHYLSKLLAYPVRFEKEWLDGVDCAPGDIILCENVRFNVGEKADDEALSKKIAALGDVFVMDAFATAHRAQASTHGVGHYVKEVAAGPLLQAELEALSCALESPKSPVVAIIGGSKVSTKLEVLRELLKKVDVLIVGGGIANTFLKAAGYEIGKSLYEAEQVEEAQQLIALAKKMGKALPLPTDVVVAKTFSVDAKASEKSLKQIESDDLILDIGHETITGYEEYIAKAGTIIWNGPVGVFEFPAFAAGTKAIAEAVAHSNAFSLAGGGDTLAAIDQFKVGDNISYRSTAGGAFIEFVEGKTLPAIAMLSQKN